MTALVTDLASALVSAGSLDRATADLARAEAERDGVALVVTLVDRHGVSEQTVLRVLDRETARVALEDFAVDTDAVREVPLDLAERRRLVPIQLDLGERRVLRVAMADPLDHRAVAEIEAQSGALVEPLLASSSEIVAAIERAYRGLVTKVMYRVRPEPLERSEDTPSPGASGRRAVFGTLEETHGTPRPSGRVRTQPIHALEQEATVEQRLRALLNALIEKDLLSMDDYQAALRRVLKRDRGSE